jgi:hypothetical protein
MIFDMIQQLAGLLDYLGKGHRHAIPCHNRLIVVRTAIAVQSALDATHRPCK